MFGFYGFLELWDLGFGVSGFRFRVLVQGSGFMLRAYRDYNWCLRESESPL